MDDLPDLKVWAETRTTPCGDKIDQDNCRCGCRAEKEESIKYSVYLGQNASITMETECHKLGSIPYYDDWTLSISNQQVSSVRAYQGRKGLTNHHQD